MNNASAPLDVRHFIDERPIGRAQWLILALCVLAALLDGFDTASMGYVAPALVQAWGVPRTQLGPVMSAALVGMAAGGLIAGPLGDRIGRKWVMIIAAILFGLTTLGAALAGSLQSLVILRLVAGLGFGAVLPNAATLLGEYSPERRRSLMVSFMFCGLTLGYSVSGFAAAALIPRYGWQSMFLVGGALPLLLAACLAVLMPESARFMVAIGRPKEQIAATLARVAPDARALLARVPAFVLPAHTGVAAGHPIRTILSAPLLFGTLLLWLVYFSGLVVVFLMSSWLPTLLKDGGYSMSASANISGLFQLGGSVGSLIVAWLMGRVGSYRTIAIAYALAGVSILVLSRSLHGTLGVLGTLVVASGFFSSGAQTPMSALAIGFYPTAARSTGTGWMLGVGRFGAILGSYIGAPLLAMGLGFSAIIAGLAIPLAIAASAIAVMGVLYRQRP
jgi:AAHS family 4-hydroxybenzoate transporter-like MFS transporter